MVLNKISVNITPFTKIQCQVHSKKKLKSSTKAVKRKDGTCPPVGGLSKIKRGHFMGKKQ